MYEVRVPQLEQAGGGRDGTSPQPWEYSAAGANRGTGVGAGGRRTTRRTDASSSDGGSAGAVRNA